MDSLINKITSGYLWDFPGGVFPPERKDLSNKQPIKTIPLSKHYIVPVKQHIGQAAALSVQVNDLVLKGQALTQLQGPMELPIHAPTSGKVIAIEPRVAAHPSGLPELSIVIESDGMDTWCVKHPTPNYLTLTKIELIDKLKQAGIAGLGGAAFPTYIKQANSQPIELLIINGVECEPYITADDMLMREHANDIVSGIEIFTHLLKPKLVVIAIESNKPEAIAAMDLACQGKTQFVVRAIPTKYPAGGEKQLIQVITGKEVPSQGITADIGIISQNVGTAYAAFRAIVHGEPLIERVVTVTGEQVAHPANVWARIGTPIEDLLTCQGYHAQKNPRLIMGGPMMGFALHTSQVPVIKSTNCILAPSDEALPVYDNEQACIRCGYCVDACPASLLPQQLYWHSKAKEYDKAEDYRLFDCIECGACAYVCPSEIPLVQYYRVAKADIKAQRAEHEKAEKAKERFNARNERLERDKQERLEKHKQAAELRKQSLQKNPEAQDKVAAALARAKAKKQSQPSSVVTETTPAKTVENSVDQSSPDNNSASAVAAAAIARAKAKRAAKNKSVNSAEQVSPSSPTDDQQPKSDTQTVTSEHKAVDSALENNDGKADKQAKAKAIAEKIKAKRAAEQQGEVNPSPESSSDNDSSSDTKAETTTDSATDTATELADQAAEDRKAKAKAIAEKIKAKRAAEQQAEVNPSAESSSESNSASDAKADTATDTTTDSADQAAEARKAKAKAIAEKIKAKRAAEQQSEVNPPAESSSESNSASDAKADTATDTTTDSTTDTATELADQAAEDRKAKAKAIAEKIKAKRAAEQLNQPKDNEETPPVVATEVVATENEQPLTDEELKQQRIKAAIAKAKAKRQALGEEQ